MLALDFLEFRGGLVCIPAGGENERLVIQNAGRAFDLLKRLRRRAGGEGERGGQGKGGQQGLGQGGVSTGGRSIGRRGPTCPVRDAAATAPKQ